MSAETIRVIDREGVQGTIDKGEDHSPDSGDHEHTVPLTLSSGGVVHIDRSKLILQENGQYFYDGTIPNTPVEGVEEYRFPLAQEELKVRREVRETGRVRISKKVVERVEHIDEPVVRENVEVRRVPIGRVVEGPIPVRQEGEVLIIPVLEEQVVIRKELVLKEELHVRKSRTESREEHDIALRSEEAIVERRSSEEPD